MRVLILEQDVIYKHYLKANFEGAGIITDVASKISEAELYISSNKNEVIILSCASITQSELQAIKRWRRRNTEIRILVLSRKDTVQDVVRVLESGADDYVAKTCHIQEIIIRVRVLARRSFMLPSQRIIFGNIEFDEQSKNIFSNNWRINLTSFEFEVMKLLVQNVGKVVSKRKIIKHLYHDWTEKNNNTVEVIVGRLRRKISPYEIGEIKNKRDSGYYYHCDLSIDK